MPEFWRIGGKLISRSRIARRIDQLLELRAGGASQSEAAGRIGTDRSFVSRLEALGELRKGGRTALIAHPIKNKEELVRLAESYGVEMVLVLNNEERWRYIERDGAALFNSITELMSDVKAFDSVVLIGSDRWVRLAERLLGDAVIAYELGSSPIEGDREVDLLLVDSILREISV
ncbi:MAG TPA: transcriptional regulator [Limnochordia bacterium]|nr:transcriptional regulator [Limnochordia bacterium]